jgi:hypothetical protein
MRFAMAGWRVLPRAPVRRIRDVREQTAIQGPAKYD